MALRNVLLASVFFLTAVAFAFGLYPAVSGFVRAVNDGVSSGSSPEGNSWSNPYSRFVPVEYEPAVSVSLDLGLAVICACGLFYGFRYLNAHRTGAHGASADLDGASAETIAIESHAQGARMKLRVWVIAAWLLGQFLWILLTTEFPENTTFVYKTAESLSLMTSLDRLWVTFVVIIVTLLYKSPASKRIRGTKGR